MSSRRPFVSHALRLESRVRKGVIFVGDLCGLVGETGAVIQGFFFKETGFGSCEGVLGPFEPSANVLGQPLLASRVSPCIAVLRETSLRRLMGRVISQDAAAAPGLDQSDG